MARAEATVWARLRALAARAGAVARGVMGAPDYDRYVAHVVLHHSGTAPMTREAFMRARLEERYAKPGAKCC